MKKIELTESELIHLIKRVINEQNTDNPFYSYLKSKGYKMVSDWRSEFSDKKSLSKDIEKSSGVFNGGSFVFFSKELGPTKSLKFITNGAKLYFLNNGSPFTSLIYPRTLKVKYPDYNGPFEIRDIKSYLL